MSRLVNSLNYLISISEHIPHGHRNYVDHCFSVFTILKDQRESEDLCLAGLLHSVYGTEFFNADLNTSRETVKNIIGDYAENVIYNFCNLKNRDYDILETLDLKDQLSQDLFKLARANLLSQTENNSDKELLNLLNLFKQQENTVKISNLSKNFSYEKVSIDQKELIVFDNFLENHYIEALNDYCSSSAFKPNHGSSKFSYERDERFACYLSLSEFYNIRLDNVVQNVANFLKKDLYAGSYYINHYSHMAQAGRHCDSSIEDTWTLIIMPNKFWEETWGGGLKFYNESSKFNYVVDFIPGRVIFFDSKIDHEVLPLTINAKRSRYSLAVKCAGVSAVEYLKHSFGDSSVVELKHV
jgi:Rps23 Pro-64 3,4-dihydroxylase Tpa1-like proline 4-hydroxylase